MAGRILIAGGSGLVGRALAAELAAGGAEVVVLTRAARAAAPSRPGIRFVAWDGRTSAGWQAECEGAAAVVNLAGENLASGRWSAARKRRLATSRLEPTRALVEAIRAVRRRPAVLVQASGVSLYDPGAAAPSDESAPAAAGFLAELVVAWEEASAPAEALGVRRVLLRSAVVLARAGGALPKMLPAFRLGLGGPLGDGRQAFPWIHLADEVAAIRFLLEGADLAGPFNLAAPDPVTNEQFSRALARALGRPCRLRVPAAALRLVLGEMADVVLTGPRVVPRRLLEAGFRFRFPALPPALADLVG